MKTIAFHSNQLGIRGTEVALYDYAFYNETILGNKSYIISDANANLDTLEKFKNKFEVFLYNKFEDCFEFVKQKNITHVYYQKAGDFDNKLIPGVKNLVHAVFQEKDIHGEVYCYISEWLANKAELPGAFVPYIVAMPEPTKNFKLKLGISDDKIVIGRHGGFNEFDIPFVYKAIKLVLEYRNDLTFLFMNTRPFMESHPNVIFAEGTYNLQHKSNFINTCDYMIHARSRGESFGLAISEFLFHDKPVISWKNGLDQSHINMLGDSGIWYHDFESCFTVLKNISKNTKPQGTHKAIVSKYSPEIVMKQFNEIFLQ
jgi:hypothetical protein